MCHVVVERYGMDAETDILLKVIPTLAVYINYHHYQHKHNEANKQRHV